MALTNKTILGKRILELQDLKKDKKITISKKQDKNFHKRVLEIQNNSLKIFKKLKYDEVNSLTKIKHLEAQLEILEEEMEIYD